MEQSVPRLSNFALTYDNEFLMDGAGSQLYRIYEIYALSRWLHVSYVHSPIKRIGYQGIIALEKNEEDLSLPQRYNEKFHIASDIEVPPDAKIVKLIFAEKEIFDELIEMARQNPKTFLLVKIAFGTRMINKKPSVLEYARIISPFKKLAKENSSAFRVAIHVRWGDLPIGCVRRLLPNEYYLAVAKKVREVCEKINISCSFELHTELPLRPFEVTPHHYGVEGRLEEPMMLDPEQYRLRDFEMLPNLKKFINTDPFKTLEQLATADLLVMSRSSFSALGAMLNQAGVAIYFPFYHPPMPGSLQHFPSILFDEGLEGFCKKWKSERSMVSTYTH